MCTTLRIVDVRCKSEEDSVTTPAVHFLTHINSCFYFRINLDLYILMCKEIYKEKIDVYCCRWAALQIGGGKRNRFSDKNVFMNVF